MSNILKDNFQDYMDSEILYNRLDLSGINIEAFNDKYKILDLEYTGENQNAYFKTGILEKIAEENKIISVKYNKGRHVYLLIEKENYDDVENMFKQGQFGAYKFEQLIVSEDDKENDGESWRISMAYVLLLNSLARTVNDASNFNGQLQQCVYQTSKEVITFIYSIKNGIMTYQQQSYKKYDETFDKGKEAFNIVSGTNGTKIVSREFKNFKGCYVKGIYNKIHRLKYDNLYVDKKNTKIDFFNKIFYAFNYTFKGIAEIKFTELPVKYKPIETVASKKDEKLQAYYGLGTVNFMVMDDINPNSKSIVKFKNTIKDMGIEIEDSTSFKTDMANIVVIHNKDYYDKNKIEDIKKDFPTDCIIQSVTIETLDENMDDSLSAISFKMFSELIIKRDLMNLFIPGWKYGPLEFYLGIRSKRSFGNDDAKHVLMRIDDKGRFTLTEDVIEIGSEFTKHINESGFRKRYGRGLNDGNVCIVKKRNDMNKIYHTNYFPLLDYEQKCKLDKKANKTRSKAAEYKHNKLLYPYVGKVLMEIDGKVNYAIGLPDNFQTSITNNTNIYCIEPIKYEEHSSDLIVEIPEMLESIHVRGNNTESVWPFPFKYLMEYLRITYKATGLYLS